MLRLLCSNYRIQYITWWDCNKGTEISKYYRRIIVVYCFNYYCGKWYHLPDNILHGHRVEYLVHLKSRQLETVELWRRYLSCRTHFLLMLGLIIPSLYHVESFQADELYCFCYVLNLCKQRWILRMNLNFKVIN